MGMNKEMETEREDERERDGRQERKKGNRGLEKKVQIKTSLVEWDYGIG